MTKREEFVEWLADYIVSASEPKFSGAFSPEPDEPNQMRIPEKGKFIWLSSDEFKKWIKPLLLEAIKDCPENWLEEHIYIRRKAKGGYSRKPSPSPYNSNPYSSASYSSFRNIDAAQKLKDAIDKQIMASFKNAIGAAPSPKIIMNDNVTDYLLQPNSNEIERYSK